MPNKNSKIARRTAGKANSNLPAEKDDGSRWVVMRDDRQVYLGGGTTKAQATRLAEGLLEPASIVEV